MGDHNAHRHKDAIGVDTDSLAILKEDTLAIALVPHSPNHNSHYEGI